MQGGLSGCACRCAHEGVRGREQGQMPGSASGCAPHLSCGQLCCLTCHPGSVLEHGPFDTRMRCVAATETGGKHNYMSTINTPPSLNHTHTQAQAHTHVFRDGAYMHVCAGMHARTLPALPSGGLFSASAASPYPTQPRSVPCGIAQAAGMLSASSARACLMQGA